MTQERSASPTPQPLKIAFINKRDTTGGGAFIAAFRLAKALEEQGAQVQLFVQAQHSKDPSVKLLYTSFFQRIWAFGMALLEQVLLLLFRSKKGPESLFSIPLPLLPLSLKALREADILHIHWINQGTLSLGNLKQLAKLNKPIVWTFHDSNAFTGGCHVKFACEQYTRSCGHCPYLNGASEKDLSHRIWAAKQATYANVPFQVISPSSWMAEQAEKSRLLHNRVIQVIPNTLDTTIFQPQERRSLRQQLGLDPDAHILLSGAMPSKKNFHKGFAYLLEALQSLNDREGTLPKLIFFGNNPMEGVEIDFPCLFLGTIYEEQKLAQYYAAADAFLLPSLDDNLPNTVLESLSCGTPVVSFRVGGLPDMIDHRENGYLAEYKSVADFAQGIRWVLEHPEPSLLSLAARQKVIRHFAPEPIAQQHLALYRKLYLHNR